MTIEERKKFLREARKKAEMIYSEYNLLNTLDNSVLCSTALHDDALINLKDALKEENAMYVEKKLSPIELSDLISELIAETRIINPFRPMGERLLCMPNEDILGERIYQKLMELIEKDNVYKKEQIRAFLGERLATSMGNTKINDAIVKSKNIEDSLLVDYYSIFLAFIERALENKNNAFSNNLLTKVKYDIAMMSPQIESILLKTHFKVEKSVYLTHKLAADMAKLPPFLQNIHFDRYGRKEAINQIVELLKISDEQIDAKNTEILFREYLLRSAFLLMSEEEIVSSNDFFHELADNRTIKVVGNKTIDIISRAYSQIKKDKCLHKHLSLRKPSL